MCLRTTTRWPCGHKEAMIDFCDKTRHPPKRRAGLREQNARRVVVVEPVVPCDEITEAEELANELELCPDPDCLTQVYWVCHECPRPESLFCADGSDDNALERMAQSRPGFGFGENWELTPELRDQLNAGRVCGSSETGTARCGHWRCHACVIGFRRCQCGCGCPRYNQYPPERLLCRPCYERKCPERAKAQADDATEDLERVLAATTERMEYNTVSRELLAACGDGVAEDAEAAEAGEFHEYAVEGYYEAEESANEDEDA